MLSCIALLLHVEALCPLAAASRRHLGLRMVHTLRRLQCATGAQDRVCRGESTFAVEMLETSSLLHHSTLASLVASHVVLE